MSDTLIIGSADFIGANLANYLIQYSGNTISSTDSLRVNTLKGLAPAMSAKTRHQFYPIDVEDEHFLKEVFKIETPKVVIYNEESYNGLKNVIKLCETYKTEKIIVLAKDLYDSEWSNSTEKKIKDDDLLTRCSNSGIALYFVKICDVIGQRQELDSFVPRILSSLINGVAVDLEEDEHIREWMHIRDVYIRIADLIKSTAESGTYRIFSGQFASKRSISKYLRILILGGVEDYTFSTGCPDTSIIIGDLNILPVQKFGYQMPENSLEDSLEHVARWYRDNKSTWGI